MKLKTASALAVAILLMGVASGQTAGTPGASERLEEVVVTAQHREEKLEEVPVSVTAFSEVAIRDSGIRTSGDFMALTPNVSFMVCASRHILWFRSRTLQPRASVRTASSKA